MLEVGWSVPSHPGDRTRFKCERENSLSSVSSFLLFQRLGAANLWVEGKTHFVVVSLAVAL